MLVKCIIQVVFSIGNINFIQNESVKGVVLNENNLMYLVDFSKETENKYIGDYREVLVNKNKCVELKN